MPLTLEQQLLTNRLPLPAHYNGYEFNTIQGYSRKSIPAYLAEDLPPMKFSQLRQQFKQINQIECPRLTYFKTKIQSKKPCERHSEHKKTSLPQLSFSEREAKIVNRKLSNIREELKYTLMTSDPNSNLVSQLINKAHSLEEQK